jgi:hypothetical protein
LRRTDLLGVAAVETAALMQTTNHIDTAQGQQGQQHVSAEGAVAHEDIPAPQLGPEVLEQAHFVGSPRTLDRLEDRAAGQRIEAAHLHDREAATRALPAGIRIEFTIRIRIGQAHTAGVHDLDRARPIRNPLQG